MNEFWTAMGLTVFAGMATGVGSVIAFTAGRTNYRFLSAATGFSAGIMLYVSFVEIFPEGLAVLSLHYGADRGPWFNAAAFFGGMLIIGLIDNLVPAAVNPHETHAEAEARPLHDPAAPPPASAASALSGPEKAAAGFHNHGRPEYNLMRMGLFTALAIGIHNFPEGMVTFLAALEDTALGIVIALAVALHNIPEGISVSVPIYYATGNRRKAFLYSLASGLAEPVGAVIGYLAILFFLGGQGEAIPPQLMGLLFGGIAGVMVYISLDELLPASRAYGKGHDSLLGLVAGMLVMALSLLLLK
ncbi:MAG TPA: zinc transporter ZupT [Syntrophales bacterium]|nr:zinc transporter ZupT [Syntrophales bacterium]